MKYKGKLFWKTFIIVALIELICFLVSYTIAFFVNDFIGRSLFALCLIFVPIVVSYFVFFNKLKEKFIFDYQKDIDKIPKAQRNITPKKR